MTDVVGPGHHYTVTSTLLSHGCHHDTHWSIVAKDATSAHVIFAPGPIVAPLQHLRTFAEYCRVPNVGTFEFRFICHLSIEKTRGKSIVLRECSLFGYILSPKEVAGEFL